MLRFSGKKIRAGNREDRFARGSIDRACQRTGAAHGNIRED
jgi:hypothetical protein